MQDASAVRTKKLYYEDAYRREFTAAVLSFNGQDLVLDQTLFFPEEGGQSPDRGILAGRRVADVQIRDGEIHHYLGEAVSCEEAAAGPSILTEEGGTTDSQTGAKEPLLPGARVFGQIDWSHRFSNMQQHSGEHLFSGIVHRRFGLDNVGFHLSDSEVTLDFNGTLTMEELLSAEAEANTAITANLESRVDFLTGEAAREAEYRSKLELSGEIRVVTFPGVDACACCAPHVARTGEIGCLKVVGAQRWKGGVRVNILCGRRAMELFDRDHGIVSESARYLSTAPGEVFGLICRMREEKAALAAKIRQLETQRMAMRAELTPPAKGSILIFEEALDQKAAQETVNLLAPKAGTFAGVFIGNDRDGYRFLIGSANADARRAAAILRETFGARGGGKPAMVQGSVTAAEAALREALG